MGGLEKIGNVKRGIAKRFILPCDEAASVVYTTKMSLIKDYGVCISISPQWGSDWLSGSSLFLSLRRFVICEQLINCFFILLVILESSLSHYSNFHRIRVAMSVCLSVCLFVCFSAPSDAVFFEASHWP